MERSSGNRPAPRGVGTGIGILLGCVLAGAVQASSHREAPQITAMPRVDGTDFYMFRSYEAGRQDFVTLLANYLESPSARRAVWQWEATLSEIAARDDASVPDPRVWRRTERQLHGETARTRWWQSLPLLRAWGLGATAAAVALTIALTLQVPVPDGVSAERVAVVNDASASPLWIIGVNVGTGEITARAVNAQAQALDKAYELWILPAEGNPQSLGLLPVAGNSSRSTIPAGLRALLVNAKGLAISVEPPGGSPTGLPTGPVVYQAAMVEL